MKMIVVVALALVAAVAAAPVENEIVKIVRSQFDQEPSGAYNFNFETENGINRNEDGQVKEVLDEENKPHQVVVVRGTYSYTDLEGKVQNINYYADETGYHAEGDSIPQPIKPVARR